MRINDQAKACKQRRLWSIPAVMQMIALGLIFSSLFAYSIFEQGFGYYAVISIVTFATIIGLVGGVGTRLERRPAIVFLFVYAAFFLLALIQGIDGEYDLERPFIYGNLLLFMSFVFIALATNIEFKTINMMFAAVSMFWIGVVLFFYFTSKPEWLFSSGIDMRLQGLTSHANRFSIILVSTYLIVYSVLRKRLALNLIVAGAFLLCEILTGSKTGYLMVALILLLITYRALASSKIPVYIKIFIALFALSIPYVGKIAVLSIIEFFNEDYYLRLVYIIENLDTSDTVTERSRIYESGLKMFLDSPFWGIGPGQQIRFIDVSHFHNFILDYLVTYGIFGLLVFSVLLILVFINVRGLPFEYRWAYRWSLIILLLHSLTGDSLSPATFFIFIVIGSMSFHYGARNTGWMANGRVFRRGRQSVLTL